MEKNSVEKKILRQLLEKGVQIPCPECVEIGSDINPERISGIDVTIHTGCKLYGAQTLLMPGVKLGYEAPVTVHNCQLGKNVELKGGFFFDSCFLDRSGIGSGAQVREACLLEEGARGAHTVGLKHTILFPYVTLGSLINFCDCLMAGGTDKKNHSEVGSSYIHFNYSPDQHKANPSLIGDVPRGVMINQDPIFLGGQGGMVGPVRIAYGTVVPAGTIVRKNILKKKVIIKNNISIVKKGSFHSGLFSNTNKIITINTIYISNLLALKRWYVDVRSMFYKNDPMEKALFDGAVDKLDKAIDERLKWFSEVAKRMPQSLELSKEIMSKNTFEKTLYKKEFFEKWSEIEGVFRAGMCHDCNSSEKDAFLSIIDKAIRRRGYNYLDIIKGLNKNEAQIGTTWLEGMVNDVSRHVWSILQGFRVIRVIEE